MTENQNQNVYLATVQEDGTGVVPMTHEDGSAVLPFDLVLFPEKVEVWNNADDDARRASMALVALHIAAILSGEGLPIPVPVNSDEDIADAYNFLMLLSNGDATDHRLSYVPDRGRFSPASLS